jgi:glycosyltransferase 2 family protein
MPAMRTARRGWWPWLKAALAVAIVGGVAWQFARLLRQPEVWEQKWTLRPEWLAISLVSYTLGFACWGGFWRRLLVRMGLRPPLAATYRAYFISQVGKYVPGKAWAILLRAMFLPGASPAVAALTALYETLTTMSAGALLTLIMLPLIGVGSPGLGWQAAGLLLIAGVPILPRVFNGLVVRLARPFLDPSVPPPEVPRGTLFEGLAWGAVGWCLLGASAVALLYAVLPAMPPLSGPFVARCVAFNAVSYVAGFLALPAPGGLGVREVILQQLLAGELRLVAPEAAADGSAAVAVVLLRLVWTAADLLAAGVMFVWRFAATR